MAFKFSVFTNLYKSIQIVIENYISPTTDNPIIKSLSFPELELRRLCTLNENKLQGYGLPTTV